MEEKIKEFTLNNEIIKPNADQISLLDLVESVNIKSGVDSANKELIALFNSIKFDSKMMEFTKKQARNLYKNINSVSYSFEDSIGSIRFLLNGKSITLIEKDGVLTTLPNEGSQTKALANQLIVDHGKNILDFIKSFEVLRINNLEFNYDKHEGLKLDKETNKDLFNSVSVASKDNVFSANFELSEAGTIKVSNPNLPTDKNQLKEIMKRLPISVKELDAVSKFYVERNMSGLKKQYENEIDFNKTLYNGERPVTNSDNLLDFINECEMDFKELNTLTNNVLSSINSHEDTKIYNIEGINYSIDKNGKVNFNIVHKNDHPNNARVSIEIVKPLFEKEFANIKTQLEIIYNKYRIAIKDNVLDFDKQNIIDDIDNQISKSEDEFDSYVKMETESAEKKNDPEIDALKMQSLNNRANLHLIKSNIDSNRFPVASYENGEYIVEVYLTKDLKIQTEIKPSKELLQSKSIEEINSYIESNRNDILASITTPKQQDKTTSLENESSFQR